MGSPQKYWQYARECARWARETNQDDDRELFERMSKAWVHIALAGGDVTREALAEASGKKS
jgi:hypothetical protein